MLTKNDLELIKKARELVNSKKVRARGVIKEVGCALITEKGLIFTGVSLDLACGLGFCAEHSAIAAMLTLTDETHIKTIVAADKENILPPCGRCRELMSLLDEKNRETQIIVDQNRKVTLKELLPSSWLEIRGNYE